MELNEELPAIELQVGDTVRLDKGGYGPWMTAIVSKIENDLIHLFRPYGTTAGFRYTGGVICYIGIEQFTRPLVKTERFFVYRREELR
jgi:hypothetical protein